MKTQPKHTKQKQWVISALIALLMLPSGCAQIRVPAIDPSGSRIFLPPGNSTQFIMPRGAPGNNAVSNPLRVAQNPAFQPRPFSAFPQPSLALNPATQYPVQPAYQHPPTPPPCNAPAVTNEPRKRLVPRIEGIKTAGQRGQIIITPSRIVAPVGSEVVVLAGICGGDGYFVKNQPLEWMLSNNSVGEFVEIGGMQHGSFGKLIPPTTKKLSGQYARGRTGMKKIVLSRGTPTPADDIELAKGQTFVSVSSASPGTSYVTSVAPNAEGWDKRRASTIIHWVDGQWAVPVPARATAGTVFPLTTVVSRTGDGGGLKGWDVRYAIVGGAPAEFAPTGSKTAETRTNNNGQATVQIRQPAGQFEPGTTQIRVDIVRPPIFGEPELVVESGITSVTWSAPALTIRAIGPRQADFDSPFTYRVEITNPGDQVARGVIVRTKNLDDGVEFISSNPKPTEYGRQFEWQLGDIIPGSSAKLIDIQLKSKKRGNIDMCFEVVSPSDRLRTEACAPTEIVVPCIGFSITGPTTAKVGDDVTFNLNVENQCDGPLENIHVRVNYDSGLIRPGKSSPATFEYPLLHFGESRTLPITFKAQATGSRCFDVEITANDVRPKLIRHCIEIRAASGTDLGAVDNGSPLVISLSGGAPMEVGGQSLIEAQITNRGSVPLERVTLVNRFSPTISPSDMTKTFEYEWIGEELWVNLGQIEPGQTIPIEIRYSGEQVDPDARSEFSVTTPSGANATRSIGMQVREAGPGIGAEGAAIPDFGARQAPANGRGIEIPDDVGPDPGELTVQVRVLDSNIRVGEQARVEFTVTNGRRTSVQDVNIRMLIPKSVRMIGLDDSQTKLRFVTNDEERQFAVQTIREMRGGINEALTWVAVVEAITPLQAIVEVQLKSSDTVGITSGSDVINIRQ